MDASCSRRMTTSCDYLEPFSVLDRERILAKLDEVGRIDVRVVFDVVQRRLGDSEDFR